MSKVFTVFIVCLLVSCGNKQQQSEVITHEKDVFKIKKTDLETLNYIDFDLDSKSKRKIPDWIKYDELLEKISELKNADLSYFKSDKKVVEALVLELATTVPEVINTDAINARILIVQNMYFKLNSTINLSTSTRDEIIKDMKDLFEAFSNLNYQINKKFERDTRNIFKPQS